jgi:ParB-like chromosome segregation protein Spo0J|tara:strand:+ start:49 stop:1185 length:1137 start_codon:yes stop_codon:yes gene_type:complete
MSNNILPKLDEIIAIIKDLNFDDKVNAINVIREKVHEVSPFKNEPVDFVRWVKNDKVISNDYNPNKVAPPEMQLLEVSIMNDGYTQPIVTFPREEVIEVVDGFHRSRVGKESLIVKERVQGYLPIVAIRKEKSTKADRISSTIRHNRARGKHQVSAMSEIVIELKNRNWKNARIGRELGMDEDEILRLCQISGLEGLFKDDDFSNAWVTDDDNTEIYQLTDEVSADDMNLVRIPNEKDENRIFHTHDKWEAVEYDFFATAHKKWTKVQCENKYKYLMVDLDEFEDVLFKVIKEWKYSCEHNLTNRSLNRIAWLGQAAMAYKYNIPCIYSSGWQLLTKEEQHDADVVALGVLNLWLKNNNLEKLELNIALQYGRQVELY